MTDDGTRLLVDWGTSSRRAWLVDEAGRRLGTFADERGLLNLPAGGWRRAYEEIRGAFPEARPRLALLAGMVGADRGWSTAPYVTCPAGPKELADRLHWVIPGEAAIVPGLCGPSEVMRGEEIQALGAVASGLVPPGGLTCHPGTHTKWVTLNEGRIERFRTVMTGEIFALLRTHGLLADLLRGEVEAGPAFLAGVDHGWTEPDLPAELFRIRARVLLGTARREDAAAYASGLLIGTDLRIGLDGTQADKVHVIGRGDLSGLFGSALGHRGKATVLIDGEAAALAGLCRIAELMS